MVWHNTQQLISWLRITKILGSAATTVQQAIESPLITPKYPNQQQNPFCLKRGYIVNRVLRVSINPELQGVVQQNNKRNFEGMRGDRWIETIQQSICQGTCTTIHASGRGVLGRS